jgi:hypothetical protein
MKSIHEWKNELLQEATGVNLGAAAQLLGSEALEVDPQLRVLLEPRIAAILADEEFQQMPKMEVLKAILAVALSKLRGKGERRLMARTAFKGLDEPGVPPEED